MYENKKVKIELRNPHKYQKQVINSKAKWRVLCCGRQFGKSTVCQILALTSMFQGKSVAYITPTFSLANVFYNQVVEKLPKEAIEYSSSSTLSIKLKNKGELKFFSGEATRNIRGNRFHRVIIDEAAFIPDLEEIWTQVVMPTLSTTNGDGIFVSTPNGREYFHSLFLKGLDKIEGYESFHFTSYDSPHVDYEYLENIRKSVPEATFRQEYLAEPLSSITNPFGSHHIKNNTVTTLSTAESIVYGIDIAKSTDWTVICGLDENFNVSFYERFRAEWSVIEERIKSLPAETMKVIDSTGVGDVVFSNLLSSTSNITGFKFTVKSKPDLMRELIVDVQAGKLKFTKPIADEMESFDYYLTPAGHPIYQAKSGYHDDGIMALAMANRYGKQHLSDKNWDIHFI